MSSEDKTPGNHYHNQSWNPSTETEENAPRPPRIATESRVLSMLKNNKNGQDQSQQQKRDDNPVPEAAPTQMTLPDGSFKLSATAKEFVPRAKVPQSALPDSSSQYNHDDPRSLSVTAPEFVPRAIGDHNSYDDQIDQYYAINPYDADPSQLINNFSGMSLHNQYNPVPVYPSNSLSTGHPILDRFNNTLFELNMHPGNMEEYLRPICEMIHQRNPSGTPSEEIANIVDAMVESLFEQSIQQPNFRYTGARICQFLNTNLKTNLCFSGFHKVFMSRCQKEYARRDDLIKGSDQDQERLRGLAMFMAEIFLNVETEIEDGTLQRMHFLPKVLMDFILTFLSTPVDANVKCSCQLLKLSGGLIEDIVKKNPDECASFEDIFVRLNSLHTKSDLSENAKFLLGSVIKLKENDWNRSTSSPPKKSMFSFTPDPNNFQAPEPIFYNTMGQACSRTEACLPEEDGDDGAYILNDEEEAAFLEWQAEQEALTGDPGAYNFNDTGYDSYQLDDFGDDGGMGDEVEAAYEEFLQEQNFMHGQQHQPAPVQPQMPSGIPPMYFNPQSLPQRPHIPQDFYGYPGQPSPVHPMQPPGHPQNQMGQPYRDPQQQQQHPPYDYNNDYHYNNRR